MSLTSTSCSPIVTSNVFWGFYVYRYYHFPLAIIMNQCGVELPQRKTVLNAPEAIISSTIIYLQNTHSLHVYQIFPITKKNGGGQ